MVRISHQVVIFDPYAAKMRPHPRFAYSPSRLNPCKLIDMTDDRA